MRQSTMVSAAADGRVVNHAAAGTRLLVEFWVSGAQTFKHFVDILEWVIEDLFSLLASEEDRGFIPTAWLMR